MFLIFRKILFEYRSQVFYQARVRHSLIFFLLIQCIDYTYIKGLERLANKFMKIY